MATHLYASMVTALINNYEANLNIFPTHYDGDTVGRFPAGCLPGTQHRSVNAPARATVICVSLYWDVLWNVQNNLISDYKYNYIGT